MARRPLTSRNGRTQELPLTESLLCRGITIALAIPGDYLIYEPSRGGLYLDASTIALINFNGFNSLNINNNGSLTYNTNPVWHDGLYNVSTFIRTTGSQIITGFLDIVGDLVGTRVQSYDGTFYGSTATANMGPAGFSGVNGSVTLRPDGIGSTTGQLSVTNTQVTHGGTALVKAGTAIASGLTMATARLLGRTTASAGGIEEVAIGTGLGMTGKVLSAALKGYIDGLKLEWVSANSLRVTSGSAYIPSLNAVVELSAAVTKSSLSLTASTWYHVYLYINGSTPDIEIVTTAPATAYSGTARAKTSDTSRRYLGSVRTDSTGAIKGFTHYPVSGEMLYSNNVDFVVANGMAAVSTTIDCSSNIPSTGTAAKCLIGNGNATVNCFYGTPNTGAVTNSSYIGPVPPNNNLSPDVPISTSQQFLYKYETTPTGAGLYVRVYGYKFDR